MSERRLEGMSQASVAALTIRDLVAAQAARNSEALALLAPGRKPLSYGGLLAQLDYVFHELRARGLGAGDRVALVLPNGPEMAVAFLGVAAASACAPLNPTYRAEEFRFYLSDLGAKAIILLAGEDSPAREVVRELGIGILELEPEAGAEPGVFRLRGARDSDSGTEGPAGPEDVALVLHTSGTTSRPKIVPLTHANLCISARNIRDSLRLSAADRCLNIMPLFHGHGLIAAITASLASGASVICTPGFVATRFFEWIDELKPTWYTGVPTMHQAILVQAQEHREVIARCLLRCIRSCSAPLPPKVMAELEEVFRVPALEAYGLTEASAQISCNPLPPARRKPGSVGLPVGCRVAVMDKERNLLPPSQTGEIVIQGGNVIIGYENNPEANESAFTGKWFRTGDQGYIDDDGYIFITGRIKEIINRGGEKISPREVDELLLTHPAVTQAVTFAVAHPQLGEEVAAAVALKPGCAVNEEELRQFAAERLAYFKVPRRVLLLEELPKGPTGKLQRIGLADRLGLRFEDLVPASGSGGGAEPQTELERQLARIWAEVLGVGRVGMEDDFFLTGGESLLAAQLVARIEEALGIRLPLAFLFMAPTVRKLSEAIANRDLPTEWPALVPIKPSGTRPPFFCIHPDDGQLLFYYDLARYLGPDQPVYGFQAVGLDGGGKLPSALEDLAAGYVAELVGLVPEGPYYLGGYCSGATLAFEMARQLEAKGRRVALLALLDAYAPGHPKQLPGSNALTSLASKAYDYFQSLGPFTEYVSWLNPAQRAYHLANLAPKLLVEMLRASLQARGIPLPALLRPRQDSVSSLLATYQPKVYQGWAVLFRPTQEPLGYVRDPLMGWGGLVAKGVKVVELDGYHRTLIFRPRNRLLAARLQESLLKA